MKKEKLEKPSIAFYKRILKVAKPFQKYFVIIMTFIIIIELSNAFRTWYIAKGVEQVMKTGLISTNIPYLIDLLIIAISLFLVRNFISYIRDWYEIKYVDYEFSKFMSQISLNKYLSFSIGQHMSQHSSISQKIVNDGQSAIQSTLNLLTFEVIPVVGNLFVSLGVLFFVNIYLGIIALFFTFISFVLFQKMNKWLVPAILNQNELGRQNSKKVSEAYRNTFLVTIENKKDTVIKKYLESYILFATESKKTWFKFFRQVFGMRFYFEAFRIAMYVLAVVMILKGLVIPGAFLMVYIWTQSVVEGVNQISNFQRRFSMGIADIQKYFELLDKEPDITDSKDAIILDTFSGNIEFKNVTFTYPKRKSDDLEDESMDEEERSMAVQDISFSISHGMKVGIVGESGSGKTTVMNLIRRAFDPTSGEICIDMIPLKEIKQESYRQHIGNVDQNVQLFDTTIRENILFGIPEDKVSEISEDQIKSVMDMACIDKFEHKLEKGVDTVIGEYGIKLSGGERQRIAIARALIKNPSILIFDEATSALDTKNERLIQDAIDNASKGRTTIIVAHRLSTVKNADKILVFNNGKVVGEGTHNQLLENCTYYKELVKEQLIEVF